MYMHLKCFIRRLSLSGVSNFFIYITYYSEKIMVSVFLQDVETANIK